MVDRLRGAAAAWNRFWFDSDGRAQIRAFRLGFGVLMFFCYAIRSFDLDLYYGEKGIMPLSIIEDVAPMAYRWSLFRAFPSMGAIWAGDIVFLASLLGVAFLKRPRVAIVLAWALHVSFIHRNLAVNYGADLISCFYLFYLLFADYREDRDFRPGDLRATLGSMAYRLCQVQLCIIYAYSGLKKLKGVSWWNGEAIWNSLAQTQLARWDFSWMAYFPLMLAAATFLTLAWEIYFPVLVWIKPIRIPMLIAGVLLHLGIAIGLNLPFFGLLMALTYVFFLDRETLGQGRRFLKKKRLISATEA
jgi:hypothetical protein